MLTVAERIELAKKAGVSEQYLYQCLTGRRGMRANLAVHVSRVSEGRIRLWDLRSADWWTVWPDLIGTAGAPKVPRGKTPRRTAVEA